MFKRRKNFLTHLALILALLSSMTIIRPVLAADITVNTSADEDGTGAACSLREAITAANTDAAYGGCSAGSGADTITLPKGGYTLSLGAQLPAVAGTLIINGNGSTIQADASPNVATWRILEVLGGGDLTLKDLSLRNGHCVNTLACTSTSSNDPDSDKGKGGAIFNSGILTLSNVAITDNVADSSGGGIYHKQGTLHVLAGSSADTANQFLNNTTVSDGGAIASGGSGLITVVNAVFFSNKAGVSGGAISSSGSTLDVTGTIFSTNSASNSGGGIVSGGNLHVKTSSFHDNSAASGGGLFNGGGTDSFVANSTFYSNTATSNGGGISNFDDLTLTNNTFTFNSATNNGGAFYSDPYQHQNDSPVRFAVVTLKNNILANSISGGDCFNFVNGTAFPITGNNNLIETDSAAPNACGTTAPINNSDPKLGTLTGFPSPQFYPLLAGSPAIDTGNDADCAAAPVSNTSQNGVTRPQGVHCDIGAVELATTPPTATPTPTATATPTPTATPVLGILGNISTRGRVGTGDNVMIGGFIINGAPVKVVVRAIGPSMGLPPSNVPGTLTDPMLQVFSGQTVIAQNDNWQGGNCPTEAPNRNPKDSREACLAITLNPGSYTAIVSGVNNTTGVALVEVFYAGGDGLLGNISTRGRVETGDNVMIGGFIVASAPVKVVVRAIGPTMGLPPANVPGTLADPVLQLFSGQTVIAQNDNWQAGNCPTEAPNRNPKDVREACLVITLNPGPYTAIVNGAGGSSGVGLVEVFLVR